MDKKIVKYSITGLLKTLTGNRKPKNDNLSLRNSLGLNESKIAQLRHLIEQNFLLNLNLIKLPMSLSLNQLVDIVVDEIQKRIQLERSIMLK